ncbi:MAG TPA: alkaline phosphatase D family protein [Rhizomicrobium sp.]|nr:alkaline phosphatase D family protein [Rhizomicrobium sp.]
MTMDMNRRAFLARFAAGAGCFVAMAGAPFAPFARAAGAKTGAVSFPQGIASGDPEPDTVILWTRAETADGGAVSLVAQMSKTADFAKVIVEQPVKASDASDHTIRLIVHGLEPYTHYFYRFLSHDGESVSPTGRTLTAPAADDPRAVNFAFLCCQNFEEGFYGAYQRLVRDDEARPKVDFVLHLGDFIYEVRGDRPDIDPANPAWLKDRDGNPRAVPPFPDGSAPWKKSPWGGDKPGAKNAVSLADYRFLYKLYLSDPYLRAARARFPFIHTWDDHEFSNDCWQTAETYGSDGVPAMTRKVAAAQSFFEYVPAILSGTGPAHDFVFAEVENTPFEGPRPDWIDKNPDNVKALETIAIYRSLRWGKHLDLVITDLRSYRSPSVYTEEVKKAAGLVLPPLDVIKTLDAGKKTDVKTLKLKNGEVKNHRAHLPPGTMMGPGQKAWFKATLKASSATWKIWANSVPAMTLRIDLSAIPFADYPDVAVTTDAWGGYPSELSELMQFIREQKIANFISCTGDHHCHGAALLPDNADAAEPRAVAAEFLVAGISSLPMFNEFDYGSRNQPAFHRLVTYQSEGKRVENLNSLLMEGCVSALLRSYTGSDMIAKATATHINPLLNYIDTTPMVMRFSASMRTKPRPNW